MDYRLKVARLLSLSPKDIASLPGAGAVPWAKLTSWRGGETFWCLSKSRRATPEDLMRDIRFDAMLVAPGRLPRHIMAAFEAE